MADRAPEAASSLICLGVVGAAHGVRGAVKVRTFTENPQDIAAYGPLTDEKGERAFIISSCQSAKGGVRVTLEGVTSRDAAEALRHVGLYVGRDKLPVLADEDDFYYSDLMGLAVYDAADMHLGQVKACHNFGAGDVLEVAFLKSLGGGTAFYPFTKAVVPQIDMAQNRLLLVPPKEDEARPDEQIAPSSKPRGADNE